MQKLVVVTDDRTKELNQYLEEGWRVKDYKLGSNHISVSCGDDIAYWTAEGSVFAYVLIEKIEEEKRERIPLNE